MVYRELLQKETGFLKEMLYEALFVPEGHPPFPRSIIDQPELSKYIEDWGRSPEDLAVVCELEGELIGIIWGRIFKRPEVGYGFVDEKTPEISIAVRQEFRNQGIGAALIIVICDLYKSMNKEAISLSVDKLSPAEALYKRAGFEIVEENGTALTMRKELR